MMVEPMNEQDVAVLPLPERLAWFYFTLIDRGEDAQRRALCSEGASFWWWSAHAVAFWRSAELVRRLLLGEEEGTTCHE